jgi:hypothetical protein
MYNDISQVVYFHHPKFAKQPQLELREIMQSSLNTLPLMTQILPQIDVFYDDDTFIPFLSDSSSKKSVVDEGDMTIDDFVTKKWEEKSSVNVGEGEESEDKRFSWLVCCSSIFLIDSKDKRIYSSYNTSLLPLVAQIIHVSKSKAIKEMVHLETMNDESTFDERNIRMDLGTAYGHVCLI